MWKLELNRIAVSFIFIAAFALFAWLNVLAQRERILVNATGIEVTGRVAAKLQTLQSSGRGNSWVNTFRVTYFDEPIDDEGNPIVGEPLVLEVFNKEIVLSEGRPVMGEFHSYEIQNVPNRLYEETEEGSQIPIIYLPSAPEKVWLKAHVDGKTKVDLSVPGVFIVIGLVLASISLVNWSGVWQSMIEFLLPSTLGP